MKIGQATGNRFEGNTMVGPVVDLAFAQAPPNAVRDSEIGKAFRIALDSASSVELQDSRGATWQISGAGLATTITPSGAALKLTYANAGQRVSVTTLELLVRPKNGAITLKTGVWDTGSRAWSESSSSTTGAVAHQVGGLMAGTCYAVSADGKPIGGFRADSGARIAFDYTGGYGAPVGFRLAPAANCVAGAPTRALFLPLVRA